MEKHLCPLCKGNSVFKYHHWGRDYFQCGNCFSLFMGKAFFSTQKRERERYLEHNNDVHDERYQRFVKPITSAVQNDFSSINTGLDFGGGTGPVITKVLTDKGFDIVDYDPFFNYRPELLEQQYDYIACCEVMEHFFDPYKEFMLLRKLLKPGGKLYCMTKLYRHSIYFKGWKYKDDDTHVFFYHRKALEFIRKEVGFISLSVHKQLIIFEG
jgi:SAM-dependent methyltransferase